MTLLRPLFFLLSAGLLLTAISGCGDGGGGDSDANPRQVYADTFSGGKDYSSGVLDLDLQISSEGDNSGDLSVQLSGPFSSSAGGSLPQFDLDAKVVGQGSSSPDFDFEGDLISTGTSAYVVQDGTAYSVDPRSFKAVVKLFDGFAEGLQFPPVELTSNLQNEGIVEVKGNRTIHVSGDLDPGRLVSSLKDLSKSAGQKVPGSSALEQLQNSVKQAHLDLYSGEDDQRVYRFVLDSETEAPEDSADASNSSAFSIDLTLSELGESQTIEAPDTAKPLSVLLAKDGGSSGDTTGGGADEEATRAYLDCVAAAEDQGAADACAELIQ